MFARGVGFPQNLHFLTTFLLKCSFGLIFLFSGKDMPISFATFLILAPVHPYLLPISS
jgi:hypothetical protein